MYPHNLTFNKLCNLTLSYVPSQVYCTQVNCVGYIAPISCSNPLCNVTLSYVHSQIYCNVTISYVHSQVYCTQMNCVGYIALISWSNPLFTLTLCTLTSDIIRKDMFIIRMHLFMINQTIQDDVCVPSPVTF